MAKQQQLNFGDINQPTPRYGAAVTNKREGKRRGGALMGNSYLGDNTRFDFNDAFGYPQSIDYKMTTALYFRSAAAAGAIDMLVSRCWQTDPRLRRGEGIEDPQEQFLNDTLDRIGFWRSMREADTRCLAASYSALILRLKDGRPLDAPVGQLRGGANAIEEIIPVWQHDIKELHMGEDETDPSTYGKVTMYQFIERDAKGKRRHSRDIHPDRVVIMSADGTMWSRMFLEPAFNSCIDIEKARGSAGESLMKDARALTHFDIAAEARLEEGIGGITKQSPGDSGGPGGGIEQEIADGLGTQVDNLNDNYDNFVLTKAMKSTMLQTKVRGVQEAWWAAANNMSVAVNIPVNILFGNQTGERASGEDAKAWLERCEARRWAELRPRILDIINRFVRWGIIDGTGQAWGIQWAPLAETDVEKQKARLEGMMAANIFFAQFGIVAYTVDQVRAAQGDLPLTPEEISEMSKHLDEVPKLPPPAPAGGVDGGGESD